MILLKELLKHIIHSQEEEGLTPVDNWRTTHTMYLEDMGFKNDGIFYYALKKPDIRLSHKKGIGYILDDKAKKEKKSFPKFKQLEEFFANYKQKFEGGMMDDEE